MRPFNITLRIYPLYPPMQAIHTHPYPQKLFIKGVFIGPLHNSFLFYMSLMKPILNCLVILFLKFSLGSYPNYVWDLPTQKIIFFVLIQINNIGNNLSKTNIYTRSARTQVRIIRVLNLKLQNVKTKWRPLKLNPAFRIFI